MASRPIPFPTSETRPFWTALQEGRLMLPKCAHCSRISYPPRPRCPNCWSTELNWIALSGAGSLRSWTDVHVDVLPGVTPPFTIAEIELNEQPGLTMTALLVGASGENIHIGAPVKMGCTDAEKVTYPHFCMTDTAESA